MPRDSTRLGWLIAVLVASPACSSDSRATFVNVDGSVGGAGSGGAPTGDGGAFSGGAVGSGGAIGSGGAPASGGSSGSGGSGTGGAFASGGAAGSTGSGGGDVSGSAGTSGAAGTSGGNAGSAGASGAAGSGGASASGGAGGSGGKGGMAGAGGKGGMAGAGGKGGMAGAGGKGGMAGAGGKGDMAGAGGDQGDGGGPPPSVEQLFPLAVGNVWNYLVTILPGSTGTSPCAAGMHATTITGKATFMNENAFTATHACAPTATRYYVDNATGLEVNVGMAWSVVLPRPVADGGVFTSASSSEVLAHVANATVAAGTFSNCWQTAYVSATGPVTTYCANVGLVSLEYDEPNGGGYRLELVSYTLK